MLMPNAKLVAMLKVKTELLMKCWEHAATQLQLQQHLLKTTTWFWKALQAQQCYILTKKATTHIQWWLKCHFQLVKMLMT